MKNEMQQCLNACGDRRRHVDFTSQLALFFDFTSTMPQFQCQCPACKKTMRLNVQGAGKVKTSCPSCGKSFQLTVPATANPQSKPSHPPPSQQTPRRPATNPAESLGGGQATRQSQPSQSLQHDPFGSDPFGAISGTSVSGGPAGSQATPLRPAYLQAGQATGRKRTAGQKRAQGRLLKSITLGGGALLLVVITAAAFFLTDFSSLSPSTIVSSIQSSFDSSDKVIADMEAIAAEAEAIGRQFPEGDQSEASAEKLLAFTDQFEALMVRACRLSPESKEVDEASFRVHDEQDRNKRPGDDTKDGEADQRSSFWHANLTADPSLRVTRAIATLTMAQIGIRTIAEHSSIELPDPRTFQHEQLDWTDDDRRLLAIIRLNGQFKRDFARHLAGIDRDEPSRSSIDQIHTLLDDFAARARELIDPNKKNKLFVSVPRGTAYTRQENASMLALQTVGRWLKDHEAIENEELIFLVKSARQLDEDIEDLMFTPAGSRLVTDGKTSHERFEIATASAAEEEAKRLAAEQKAERERKEAEQRRIAEAEKKRLADEERRKKEAERRAAENDPGPASVANDDSSPSTRPGFGGLGRGPRSMGPTGRFGGPRFGPSGRGASNAGPAGIQGNRFGPDARRSDRPAPPPPGPNDVTITVGDAEGLGGPEMLRSLPDWIRKYPLSMSQTGGRLIIRVTNYDRPLTELEKAFPQLQFDSIDDSARQIEAKKATGQP
ncbi:hypothetical protein U8335_03185 [Roseiconus lacunae]|uniref:hypothetical protein n=1 Tax=Roseiconus lacunae TaxID=2605694 RepID=UPI003091F711|nr:hypothetical protein U8335_03185 [Stieleria sp. HD01]